MSKFNQFLLPMTLCMGLSACGGSGSETVDKGLNNINDAYKNIEAKLTNKEKSMAEILKGIFLPEESLDNFLDKITPEGGKGGLYVGYFVEDNDNDTKDSDIGAVYFDIGKDFASSVYGQMSYQQKTCQASNLLTSNNISVKTDEAIGGAFSGTLDPATAFDNAVLKFLQFDKLKTTVSGMPFNGQYDDKTDSWNGQYTYAVGLDFGKELFSNNDGCDVRYTLSDKGDFHIHPLNYKLGTLNLKLSGTGSTTNLNWTTPSDTAYTLVSQINVDKATNHQTGFVRTNQMTYGNTFTPFIDSSKANYAFVVQTFDSQNRLTGFQAIVQDL
ncbi:MULTISPECIES: hypothetical protein [unclassified Moraxella]|uniref:hypothetical protein n=1 Tax=unclassified Moraxella TaxID=2685852 RepID=UPI003AF7783F